MLFRSDTKPLLHLWSLGIEEQFYIVFPLFVWLPGDAMSGASADVLMLGILLAFVLSPSCCRMS